MPQRSFFFFLFFVPDGDEARSSWTSGDSCRPSREANQVVAEKQEEEKRIMTKTALVLESARHRRRHRTTESRVGKQAGLVIVQVDRPVGPLSHCLRFFFGAQVGLRGQAGVGVGRESELELCRGTESGRERGRAETRREAESLFFRTIQS